MSKRKPKTRAQKKQRAKDVRQRNAHALGPLDDPMHGTKNHRLAAWERKARGIDPA